MAWRRHRHSARPYALVFKETAQRQFAAGVSPSVAVEALEFIATELADDPQGCGRRLQPYAELLSANEGSFRVIYAIDDVDRVITVVTVAGA